MYLTAGQYKGTKIDVPNNVKPTLSKVRESIFNMLLQFELEDNSFLDMFCGSGIMGMEAVSRGYDVVELEINPKNISIIKSNYSKIKMIPKIFKIDSLKFVSDKKYSIIYIDPPWDFDYVLALKKAETLLNNHGIVFVEHDKTRQTDIKKLLFDNNINLSHIKSKKYGRCLIDVLGGLAV